MTHLPRFLVTAGSLTAIIIFIVTLSASESLAQTGTPNSSPAPPAANRIDKLEEQVAALDKKIQNKPKDTWDKLGLVSGFISGILVVLIGSYATYILKHKETTLMEAENKRRDEDRQATYELALLSNKRAEIQLTMERENKKKEINISQAQTVRDMLPSLQSDDPTTKQASLTLIAFLGNAELAAQLSQLYETDLGPVLQTIAAMPGATSETRRQAAVALGGLGSKQEAVNSLVELSKDAKAEPAEQLFVAEGLEKLDEPEKAMELQVSVLLNAKTTAEERSRVVAALGRPQSVQQAKKRLWEIVCDKNAETTNRLAAIEALFALGGTEEEKNEWTAILAEMVRSATAPADLKAISATFKNIGREQQATEVLWQISSDPEGDITKRYAAIDNLTKLGAEKDVPGLPEKRDEITQKLVHDPQVKASLRLSALREWPGPKEEKLKVLQEVSSSPAAGFMSRLVARGMITSLNNEGITSGGAGGNVLSSIWKAWRNKPEASNTNEAEAPVAEEQVQPEGSKEVETTASSEL